MDRINRRLDSIWEIGRTENGGVTRLAYSDEETEAIDYILDDLDLSFDTHVDHMGNVFASKEPNSDNSVYLGSHLDSVFNGGKLDGALGVVVAIEAIETAYEHGIPEIAPTLTIFRGEESSRFGQWAVGSRGALGQLTVDDLSATDQSDIPLWQAMQKQGLQPKNFSEPTIDLDRISCFLEVHIEQGRVLDESEEQIGIVDSIRAPVRYRITVEGNYDHSGATPMGLRRDALVGSAEMITAIERIGNEANKSGDIVATVGELEPSKSAINKICGNVSFSLDIRSNDQQYRDKVEERILETIRSISDERDLTVTTTLIDRGEPVKLDGAKIERLEGAASSIDRNYRIISSGGGHDAMNFQHTGIPAGMIFVPSVDGISHSPKEDTPDEAVRDATAIFTEVLLSGIPDTV